MDEEREILAARHKGQEQKEKEGQEKEKGADGGDKLPPAPAAPEDKAE